jgi:hypothetical protein
LEQKTGNFGQGKWVEVWKAVSLVVEQSAIRRCDLTSNSTETAIWEVITLDKDRVPYAQNYFPELLDNNDLGMANIRTSQVSIDRTTAM